MPITFSQINALPDALATDRHELVFPSIQDVDGYELTLRHTTVTLPAIGIAQIRVKYLGYPIAFRGGDTFDNVLNVSFQETVDGAVAKALLAWSQVARNRNTGEGGLKSEYSANGQFTIYDTTGSPSLKFVAYNMWPFMVTYPNWSEESGTAHIDVQFSVDAVDLVQDGGDEYGSGGSTGDYYRHQTGNRNPYGMGDSEEYAPVDPGNIDFGTAIYNIGINGSPSAVKSLLKIGAYALQSSDAIIPSTALTLAQFASNFSDYF